VGLFIGIPCFVQARQSCESETPRNGHVFPKSAPSVLCLKFAKSGTPQAFVGAPFIYLGCLAKTKSICFETQSVCSLHILLLSRA
jgi:hypothetical protein